MNDEEVMQYVEQIITKITAESSIFPNPVPELSSIESLLLEFRLAATEAAFNDSRAIRIRNDKRKELEYQVNELKKYVDTVAKNDAVIIQSAGFFLSKTSVKYTGLVPKIKRLTAEPEQLGSLRIKLQANPWKGAHAYRFEYRKVGEADWNIALSTKSTYTLSGLEKFAEYEFRASYLGVNPEPNYSDIVTTHAI